MKATQSFKNKIKFRLFSIVRKEGKPFFSIIDILLRLAYLQGYCQPRAYIATQAPVPDTFEDFWRMVWEQESAAVVMLTREEEAGKVIKRVVLGLVSTTEASFKIKLQ